jgi:hypothetical protein
MKKDAYYFPHFSNARNDAKLIKIRRVFGIEGYGIYFMLLEVLREQTEFKLPLSSIEDYAFEWHTSKEKILSIINDFELFDIIDNKFFSAKLVHYLQPYLEKSERARQAALKRWNNTKADANALQMHCTGNASKVKESKVKESKVKDNCIYNTFYDKQIEISKNDKNYSLLVGFIFGRNSLKEKLNGVLSIRDQLTFEQFEKIYTKCKANKIKIGDILTGIENDKKYYKGKISLYRTMLTWTK